MRKKIIVIGVVFSSLVLATVILLPFMVSVKQWDGLTHRDVRITVKAGDSGTPVANAEVFFHRRISMRHKVPVGLTVVLEKTDLHKKPTRGDAQ